MARNKDDLHIPAPQITEVVVTPKIVMILRAVGIAVLAVAAFLGVLGMSVAYFNVNSRLAQLEKGSDCRARYLSTEQDAFVKAVVTYNLHKNDPSAIAAATAAMNNASAEYSKAVNPGGVCQGGK